MDSQRTMGCLTAKKFQASKGERLALGLGLVLQAKVEVIRKGR